MKYGKSPESASSRHRRSAPNSKSTTQTSSQLIYIRSLIAPCIVLLSLLVAWILGLNASASLIVSAAALGLYLSVRGPAGSIGSRLPLIYVGIVLLSGYISSLVLFKYLNRPRLQADDWAIGYLAFQWSAIAANFLFLKYWPRAPRAQNFIYRPIGLVLLAVLSTIGVFAVARQIPTNYFSDPQLARQSISTSVSPIMQIFYKCTIVATIACGYQYLEHTTGRARIVAYCTIGCIGIAALSLYGGRFLVLSTIVGLFLIWVRCGNSVRWVLTLTMAAMTYIGASAIAAYRYFSFYGIGLAWEGFAVTAVSQASTEFLDGLQISESHQVPVTLARETLIQELLNSIPNVIATLFGIGEYDQISMGRLASQALGQTAVGGIRIGAVGELKLAFGFAGLLCVGVLLGLLLARLARLEMTRGASGVSAIIGSLLTLSVLILGLGVTLSSLSVYVLSALILRPDPPERAWYR